jgi:hypothetical protein
VTDADEFAVDSTILSATCEAESLDWPISHKWVDSSASRRPGVIALPELDEMPLGHTRTQRARLPGHLGDLPARRGGSGWIARTLFRDVDGRTKQAERSGKTMRAL